ncbi:MAG: TetR/AcrR family transcriptional regulator [Pseudomonadota bacterium]
MAKTSTKVLRSRNDEEKTARREALLDAAQTAFVNKGYENTSMDDIASEAGFSRGLLYVYFKDKKDIFHALRVRSVEALRDTMLKHVDRSAEGITRVRQVGEAFYNFYKNQRSNFDCLSLNISLNAQDTELKRGVDHDTDSLNAEKQTMQIMLDALKAGVEDGSIDPAKVENPLQTAMFLRGSLHGVILLQDETGSAMLNTEISDKDALVDFTLTNMTNAIRP